ncbi:hypothetical protein [Rhodococcus sp. (in: high G+C Gram-positive bacteria)]|uniref:hypothetical protein n=1 Tax=Rhodococcus sp. TaxID=1831 RepID=UPI003B8A96A9
MGDTGHTRDTTTDGEQRGLPSRSASTPTLYWITGVALSYYTSERVSWNSGETYWENALKWHNLPVFAILTIICLLAEYLYRTNKLPDLRALALAPFIIFQLRFALWLLYYPTYWLFWLGLASAITLTIAAAKLNRTHTA